MTEFGLIENLARLFGDVDLGGWEAIGDDCTVVAIGQGEVLCITTDMLQEDVHFLRSATSAYELGRKALAVNLSDVAAMGVRPCATLLSIALTEDATEGWAEEFLRGYHSLSKEYGVALVGGDTTRSKAGISINVVAIGRGKAECVKRRSAARKGDVIFVGGVLGESALGLKDILAGRYDTPCAEVHRNPEAQILQGEWLGSKPQVHAMMDLSDGLASDLCHILRMSGCGAEIDVERIPAAHGDLQSAVCGGEDYKLLFTVDAAMTDSLQSEFMAKFGEQIYPIGRIIESAEPRIKWLCQNEEFFPDWRGFTHF